MRALIILLILCTTAHAAPFLVCDAQTGVTHYQITGDIEAEPQAEQNGSIRYDLAGIEAGDYNLNVVACNEWGCSQATQFFFTKSLPQSPMNIGLEP